MNISSFQRLQRPPRPPTDQTSQTSPRRSDRRENRRLLMIIAGALICLIVLAVFCTLYFTQVVFFPLALAVILKLVFNPVVRCLNKRRVPNSVGAGLVVGGILVLIAAGLIFLSGPATKWFDEPPRQFRVVEAKLRSLKEPMKKFSDASAQVADLADVSGENGSVPVEVQQPSLSVELFATTSEVVFGAFLTLVMLYFLLAEGDRALERLLNAAPERISKRKIVSAAHDIQQSMSSYLFATTCINAGLGLVIGCGMWLVGLPNPVLWGVMAACLNYVPYFGCLVGAGTVFFVAVISLDSLGQAVWPPAIYLVANVIEGYFVTPAILGRSIRLSPLAIVIGMIFWGWLWGVCGMLVAVPILAATKIACDHIQPLRPLGQLLGR